MKKNYKVKKFNRKRTFLFIDGTNLYAGQYKLFGPKRYLDFSKFVSIIEKQLRVKFNKIYFYASYSPKSKKPTKKEKLYLKNEALFYKSVRRTKKVFFFKGYRSPTSGKEKEVDVKLAVDIVNLAHLDKYQSCFLMSGDADFMHAVRIARGLGKTVFVLALENRIPNRLSYFYPTIIFLFNRRLGQKISPRQKIRTIFLSRKILAREA